MQDSINPAPQELHIAEIPYESGAIRFRYARYMLSDGSRWIMHGLFLAYYESGTVASEGSYVHGKEEGTWCDFHENGHPAAKGQYVNGLQEGEWEFWSASGSSEPAIRYAAGVECS